MKWAEATCSWGKYTAVPLDVNIGGGCTFCYFSSTAIWARGKLLISFHRTGVAPTSYLGGESWSQQLKLRLIFRNVPWPLAELLQAACCIHLPIKQGDISQTSNLTCGRSWGKPSPPLLKPVRNFQRLAVHLQQAPFGNSFSGE